MEGGKFERERERERERDVTLFRYGPATQVRWLEDPKPADNAAAVVAKQPASTPPPR